MTGVGVLLDDGDLNACHAWATQRTEHWKGEGNGWSRDKVTNYDENLYGVKGELALAKALNVFYKGFDKLLEADREGDVGKYQVKATLHKDGHLIFQNTHRMGVQTVLAIVGTNKVRLAGWLHFDTAKTIVATGIGRMERRRPNELHMCWWIPQTALEGMEWLPIVYGPEVVKL